MSSGLALCFPGQGSQAAGMAESLLGLASAQSLLAVAADCGLDLQAALAGDDDTLRPTAVAQPALFLVEVVLAEGLAELPIVGVAGHSVGEYAAAVAAGSLGRDDGMRLVIRRGSLMQQMQEGTMAAILGLDVAAITDVCRQASADEDPVVVANLNAPGQVVISGTVRAVERASALAKERGAKRALRLNVSGAFHSPLMEDAAREFAADLAGVEFRTPRFPVVCNVDGSAAHDGESLRQRLMRQLQSPVQWMAVVAELQSLGARSLLEVGPGTVLSGLARRIDPELRCQSVTDWPQVQRVAAEMKVSA